MIRDGMQIFIINTPLWYACDGRRGFGMNEWDVEDGKNNNRIAELTCTYVELTTGAILYPEPMYISCYRAFSYPKRPLPDDSSKIMHYVPIDRFFPTRKLAERNYY